MNVDHAVRSETSHAGRPDDGRPGDDGVRWPLVAAEFGLLALAAGTVATFTRLFSGTDFLWSIGVPLVAAWASAIVLRRSGLAASWSALVSLVVGVGILTWWFVPWTTWFGVPTVRTAEVVAEAISTSFGGFSEQVAPVPATEGFVIVIAAVLWLFVVFADTSALRYRAPVQAVIPYAAMVVTSGVLARATGRVAAAAACLVGLAAYVVTQRVWRASTVGWRPGDLRAGVRATAVAASVIAAGVLATSVVVAPLLPGDDQAVVDLRSLGRGAGPRTVVSPFVGVTSLLGERSNELMFTVRAEAPAYWRLTALEQYDPARGIWTSRGTYRSTEGELAAPVDGTPSLVQEFQLAGLGGLWLPAAFEPSSVEASIPVGFDEASSSLIARDDANTPGSTYRVRSNLRTVATRPEPPVPSDPDPATAAGTEEISPAAVALARLIAGNVADPLERALRLQDHLRGPGAVYDTTVDYRNEPDPVAAFLTERRGFCQQFASTYALMARAVGLPSRVAVGFTPGDQAGDQTGAFVVRGRHAHAWPEVEIPGVGWVAFEPTPGRGDPSTSSYTGVEAAQAEPPDDEAITTSSSTTTTQAAAPATTTPAFDASAATTVPPEQVPSGPGRSPAATAVVALAVVVAGGVALLVGRRWRRHRRRQRDRDDPHLGPVAVAWRRATDSFRSIGFPIEASETPLEFARRISADPDLADLDQADLARAIQELATIETARRYGPRRPSEETVERADVLADGVGAAVRSRLDRRQLLLERVR